VRCIGAPVMYVERAGRPVRLARCGCHWIARRGNPAGPNTLRGSGQGARQKGPGGLSPGAETTLG